jgi:ABC-type phosphate transport system auxiliary subunit
MSYLQDIDDRTIDEMGREWVYKLNKAVKQLEQQRLFVRRMELDIDTAKRMVADLRAERSRRERDHGSAA